MMRADWALLNLLQVAAAGQMQMFICLLLYWELLQTKCEPALWNITIWIIGTFLRMSLTLMYLLLALPQ